MGKILLKSIYERISVGQDITVVESCLQKVGTLVGSLAGAPIYRVRKQDARRAVDGGNLSEVERETLLEIKCEIEKSPLEFLDIIIG